MSYKTTCICDKCGTTEITENKDNGNIVLPKSWKELYIRLDYELTRNFVLCPKCHKGIFDKITDLIVSDAE